MMKVLQEACCSLGDGHRVPGIPKPVGEQFHVVQEELRQRQWLVGEVINCTPCLTYLVGVHSRVHFELEHPSDKQLGLDDGISDEPEIRIIFGGFNGAVQREMHHAYEISNFDWFVLDFSGQV